MSRRIAGLRSLGALVLLAGAAVFAPQHLSEPDLSLSFAGPDRLYPFGADQRGRPLLQYAQQGASVILWPAMAAGALVGFMGVLGGLLRCVGDQRIDAGVSAFGEVVGALPRMVVILVAALLIPSGSRGLLPLALAWAILASPGAMDEAAAVAERLGGAAVAASRRLAEAVTLEISALAQQGVRHVPGFGHRFHPIDPRAPRLLELVDGAAKAGVVGGR